MYNLNIKPTVAAMNFSSSFKYESTDMKRALAGYQSGTVMGTLYDRDLVSTFVDR